MTVALPVDVSPRLDIGGALAVASVVALWALCWGITQRPSSAGRKPERANVRTMLEVDEAAQGIRSAHTPPPETFDLCPRCETSWPCETYLWQEQWLERVSWTESAS